MKKKIPLDKLLSIFIEISRIDPFISNSLSSLTENFYAHIQIGVNMKWNKIEKYVVGGGKDQSAKHYANELKEKILHEMKFLNPIRSLLLVFSHIQSS